MSEYLPYKADMPGSRRAPCLGCGQRVITARDPHVVIAGKRDGSLLVMVDAEPQLALATDPDRIFTEPGLEWLGVAHRACANLARQRLEDQEAELPDTLVPLVVREGGPDLPRLHLPPQSGACPFCGDQETTDEHIWAKWISRELASHGLTRPLNRTVPVCEKCNHRWLSVLENDVAPILGPMVRGEERTLSPDEQRLVATWAVKTAFMLDLASEDPCVPTGFYYDLRQRRSALPSNVVWVAGYCGSRWAAWASHTGLHSGIDGDESPNAFVSTFTAFRVVFQVFGHFKKGGATLNESRQLAVALARIWPPSDQAIDWPPGKLAFGDDSLLELASSVTAREQAGQQDR